jgi:hypothetical protein
MPGGARDEDLHAVADLCERLHAARCSTAVPAEQYELPFAAELRAGLAAARTAGVNAGPYGAQLHDLVARNRGRVNDLMAEVDEIAVACQADPAPTVLTHGEPGGNNVLRDVAGRLHLLDWGDLAYGPPERDWGALATYGLRLPARPTFARFYTLRWILSEIAECVARFAAPAHRQQRRRPQVGGTRAVSPLIGAHATPSLRTFATLVRSGQAPLEQIQLALGHQSIQTTQRYLGSELNLADAVCGRLGIRPG